MDLKEQIQSMIYVSSIFLKANGDCYGYYSLNIFCLRGIGRAVKLKTNIFFFSGFE